MRIYPLARSKVAKARARVASLVEDATLPIDLREIAGSLGIDVVEDDIGRVDAFIMPEGGRYLAVVNSTQFPTRRRFSLAHEIAHVVLAGEIADPKFRYTECSAARNNPIERACNELASDMLMPEWVFRQHANAQGWNLKGIVSLSGIFDTSFEATIRRCIDLSNEPLFMVKWRLDAETLSPRPDYAYSNCFDVLGFETHANGYDSSLYKAQAEEGVWWGDVCFRVMLKEQDVVRRTPQGLAVRIPRDRHGSRESILRTTEGIPTESMRVGRGENPLVFSLAHPHEGQAPPRRAHKS